MRYCLFGWGVPAIAVSIFVIIDQILSKGFIGYGEGEAYCFISKPEAVLYFFVAPVALIMLFNAFALVHTVLHIVKTRKRTQKVTNQRHSTGVALVFVKMASVMGVTWILGIVANVKALSFLWYPYVILNSLQGLFIFLSFAASGKAQAEKGIARHIDASSAVWNLIDNGKLANQIARLAAIAVVLALTIKLLKGCTCRETKYDFGSPAEMNMLNVFHYGGWGIKTLYHNAIKDANYSFVVD
ncbi:probable G-protein coupled receptor Mth-like 1 [Montipora capricornis]|uniref:probable G-protein coupled receptor Mth-like 1 n=1 Tax=Montipora capricornis TaxID=246305 RepID=UPI0035F17072